MSYEIIESDCYYHIYNQGNNKEDIFKEAMNYNHFLNLMKKYIVPVAEILSYCLMKNHFHLLIHTKELETNQTFSQAISNLCNAYAKAINKKYNRTGSLFRVRYRRKKVTNENYLKQLIVYINLNPVYHGFTKNVYAYKYSSLMILLSKRKTFLSRTEVLELFDGRENFQYYLEYKTLEFDEKMNSLVLE
jgi:putative transposase